MTTTPKLAKVWKLTDKITNLEMVFSNREDVCDFEHSDTVIDAGYFVTAEQLRRVFMTGRSTLGSDGQYVTWDTYKKELIDD